MSASKTPDPETFPLTADGAYLEAAENDTEREERERQEDYDCEVEASRNASFERLAACEWANEQLTKLGLSKSHAIFVVSGWNDNPDITSKAYMVDLRGKVIATSFGNTGNQAAISLFYLIIDALKRLLNE